MLNSIDSKQELKYVTADTPSEPVTTFSVSDTNTFRNKKQILNKQTIDIVIARYEENISWAFKENFRPYRKIVYNKGSKKIFTSDSKCFKEFEDTNSMEILLPNVGRESHSFLYHIIENYDELAGVTIFIPGSGMDSIKQHKTLNVLNKTISTKDSVFMGMWYENVKKSLSSFQISDWVGTSSTNQQALPSISCQPSNIRPFGNWYEFYFQNTLINVVCYTSTFSVTREDVHHRSKSFYEDLLATVSSHSNPETGHFMERSWLAVFHPVKVSCYNIFILI